MAVRQCKPSGSDPRRRSGWRPVASARGRAGGGEAGNPDARSAANGTGPEKSQTQEGRQDAEILDGSSRFLVAFLRGGLAGHRPGGADAP